MKTITDKRIKEVVTCVCGFNASTDYTAAIPIRLLLKDGYKRTKDKSSGAVFYRKIDAWNHCPHPNLFEPGENP